MVRLLCVFIWITSFVPAISSHVPELSSHENKTVQSLETGDWLLMELAEYYPYVAPGMEEEVPWRAENIRRSIFRATVTAKDAEKISFEYQLISIYDCSNIPERNAIYYYDSQYESDIFSYASDTDYVSWMIHHQDIKKGTKLASATYNLATGKLVDLSNDNQSLLLEYRKKIMSVGIRNNEKTPYEYYKIGYLNAARLITKGMKDWIVQCNSNKKITSSLQQAPEYGKVTSGTKPTFPLKEEDIPGFLLPAEVRVIGASFQLPPNVKLTYSEITPSNKPVETKIRSFFIPYPIKYHTDKNKYYSWLITPGDSIVRIFDEKNNPSFSGRGSEENNFHYRHRHLDYTWITDFETGEYSEKELNNFLGGTTGFWRRSFELDMLYSYIGRVLWLNYFDHEMNNQFEEPDWAANYFGKILPLTDGWYNPGSFETFLRSYLLYKQRCSVSDVFNSFVRDYHLVSRSNIKKTYYLNKFFLVGYPQRFINAKDLMNMMYKDFLSQSEVEYEDFISECPDTHILNNVVKQHQLLESLEKGNNIKDSNLSIPKMLLSGKTNKRDYILLNLSLSYFYSGGNTKKLKIHELLEQKNLLSNTSVFIINPAEPGTPTESKGNEPIKEFIISYLPKAEIEADLADFDYHSLTILMRNDGTILYRKIQRLPWLDEEKIVDIIQSDINRGQSDFTKGFRRGLLITLSIGFIILLFAKIYWDRKRKEEKEQRLVKELELKAIRSQMNPHFIFNALGSIQNLLGKGANEDANDYLVRFSRLLRTVLNNSEKKLVPLSGEIEQLYLYLTLEQLRFPFTYAIEVDEMLETDLIEIPGMLIQPFVENAVKHAIAPRNGGEIKIGMQLRDNILHVTILDDGPGITTGQSDGFGMKAIADEIDILKSLYHTEIEISIENRQDSEAYSGLKVELAIPIG